MPLAKIRNWYGKYERPISSLSLVAGFVFDALTLKRVDLFWENLWVVAHIVIVGTCIVLINSIEKQEGDEANPSRLHFWLVNLQQFFYGGIWSTFLVFYFRSSDIFVSWPFLLILALSFWANESLKRQFVRLFFQISLFFLAVFCFAIYLIPVLLHRIGTEVFILSGLASLVFIALFLLLIRRTSGKKINENKKLLYALIVGVYVLVNTLYFTKLIPPLPLSLKDSGVYHSLKRNSQGNYVVTEEAYGIKDTFNLYPSFHKLPGEPVYVYSAIFSPPSLNLNVVHEWQYKDPQSGKFVTKDRINLKVVGGREGGFRTYSVKYSVLPGQWRVNVLTENGLVVGRVRFNIAEVSDKAEITEKIKE